MNKEELLPINRYEFASMSASCDIFKKFDEVQVISNKTMAYDNAIGMSDIIEAVCFDKSESIDDMFELASQVTGYEEEYNDEFDAENAALKAATEKKAFRWRRYCTAELARNRVNYAPMFSQLVINVGDIYAVPFKPKELFISKSGLTGRVNVEAVYLSDKKAPSGITDKTSIVEEIADYDAKLEKKGIKVDKLSRERLEHVPLWKDEYLGVKYIETLLDTNEAFRKLLGVKDGDIVEATGSVYYMEMKSNDDKEPDFFAGNSNVIRISEAYITGEDNLSKLTEYDTLFTDYAKMHVLGMPSERCTKQDCEYCTKSASCRFQKTPAKQEKVEKSSNASKDFAPTAAQQMLIDVAKLVNR